MSTKTTALNKAADGYFASRLKARAARAEAPTVAGIRANAKLRKQAATKLIASIRADLAAEIAADKKASDRAKKAAAKAKAKKPNAKSRRAIKQAKAISKPTAKKAAKRVIPAARRLGGSDQVVSAPAPLPSTL